MNKFIFYFLISLLFLSCNKDEKKIVSIVKKTLILKEKLQAQLLPQELTTKKLVLLKEYADNIDLGAKLLEKLYKKKSSLKKIKKQLSKSQDTKLLCSKLFLNKKHFFEIKNECQVSYFNICPLSFGNYEKNTQKIIQILISILNKDFLKTDCKKYLTGEYQI